MREVFDRVATRVFVDGVWLHRWGCHRLSGRSFFVQGRQFHICARCTGIVIGIPCSLLFLPLRRELPLVFCFFALALVLDGLTQMARWRASSNGLRFATGFGAAATFLPALVAIAGRLA